MAVKQRDIAAAAGVSVTTVSFVLAGRAEEMHLSRATVRRVEDAAARLGFTPNYHAQALSTGRARTLGLITGGERRVLLHRFWSPVAAGVGVHASERGHNVLIMADGVGSTSDNAAEFLRQKRIDGLIAFAYPSPPPLHVGPKAPVVIIGGRGWSHATVTLDDVAGIAAAMSHLVDLGHRDILYVGDTGCEANVSQRRARAFRAAGRRTGVRTRQLDLDRTHPADLSDDAFIQLYRDQLAATLKLPASTSAAICYNDNVAVAFCAVLGERGLRVPADISVIGFDDLHAASAIPPLTTVSHMLEEMGAAAVDLLLDMIERTKRPRDLVVTPRLVIRASTASARRSAG
ncbi:LacI family transcriptional regulator [bacterium]|nr:LacI family transcriptional regulator [bacterium]